MANEIELSIDYPSNVAEKLIHNELDIGLIPVAAIPRLNEYHIISNYCIAADGPVASVCLFSDVPLSEIKKIFLDYQSRTSVALLKVLLKEHWRITPQLIMGETGYEDLVTGATAGLIIGDRAFRKRLTSNYIFDLGEAWKQMTGQPFVFAAWVSNKKLDDNFLIAFNKAVASGFQHLEEIVSLNKCPNFDLMNYYTKFIQFKVGYNIEETIESFLNKKAVI